MAGFSRDKRGQFATVGNSAILGVGRLTGLVPPAELAPRPPSLGQRRLPKHNDKKTSRAKGNAALVCVPLAAVGQGVLVRGGGGRRSKRSTSRKQTQ